MKIKSSIRSFALLLTAIAFSLSQTEAATWHVSPTGNDAAAGTTPGTAKQTIQAAVDASSAGDTVLVTDGTYATGGSGGNRVYINKAITVQSVNGPGVTTIDGADSVRCVYLSANATLSGFRVMRGLPSTPIDGRFDGGGIYSPSNDGIPNGIVSRCIITGNRANEPGNGGGCFGVRLANCLLTQNDARPGLGGGAFDCFLDNCSVVYNDAGNGGGIANCTAYYSILYFNYKSEFGAHGDNFLESLVLRCCSSPLTFVELQDNIDTEPTFVNGSLHLSVWEFWCVDMGDFVANPSPGAMDLAGNPRIHNGRVDLGCYENQVVWSDIIDPNEELLNAALDIYKRALQDAYDFGDPLSLTGTRCRSLLNAALDIYNGDIDATDPLKVCSQAQINAIRIDGRNDVISSPNSYSLYTLGQYDASFDTGFGTGRTAGRSDVTSSPNTYDLYALSQVQALNAGTPLLARDAATGKFKLTLGVQKSTNLAAVPFTDVPMNGAGMTTTLNAQGKVDFEFPSSDNAAFFRVQAGPGSSRFGNALNLNGVSQSVSVPAAAASAVSSPMTIEAWVYVRSYSSWSRLMDFGNASGFNNIACVLSNSTSGKPSFYFFNESAAIIGSLVAPSPLPLNTWTHLAFTYDGTNGRIYLNGSLAVSGAMPAPPSATRTSNLIGRSNFGDPNANAIIDEFRLWSVARTPAQIQGALGSPIIGSETGLQLYYRFDSATGSVTPNSATATGAAYDGTLNNFPTSVPGPP